MIDGVFIPYGIINFSNQSDDVFVEGSNKWIITAKPNSSDAQKVIDTLGIVVRYNENNMRNWAKNVGTPKHREAPLQVGTILGYLGVRKKHMGWPQGAYFGKKIGVRYSYAPIYDLEMFKKYNYELRGALYSLNKGHGKRKDYMGAIKAIIKADEYLQQTVKPCDVCRFPSGKQRATQKGQVKSCENCAGHGRYASDKMATFKRYSKDLEPYYFYPHRLQENYSSSEPCYKKVMMFGEGNIGSSPECPDCGLKGFKIDPSKFTIRAGKQHKPCEVCEGVGGKVCAKCEGSGFLTKGDNK